MKKVNAVFLLRCPINEYQEAKEFLEHVLENTDIVFYKYSDNQFKVRELIPADYLEVKK